MAKSLNGLLNSIIFLLLLLLAAAMSIESCENAHSDKKNEKERENINSEESMGILTNISLSYNFNKPDKLIALPKRLTEISGISLINDDIIACVQDEVGFVFFYSLSENEIKRKIKFEKQGDFEDITLFGSSLFILRSDGALFEIENFEDYDFKVNLIETDIESNNLEGLCCDVENNRLLIISKAPVKEKKYKNSSPVFSFDAKTRTLNETPAFIINYDDIEEAIKNSGVKNKGKKANLHASAIAIHPISKEIYILSAADRTLLISNQNGKVLNLLELDPTVFKQPEGITFSAGGDLYISNEGGGGTANILKFNYLGKI